jgi:catechol 2,3-dioxygenase-like lactoylglutathione lyase family enzyme
MTSPISGIDHPILWVSDLEQAANRYRRLGFTLSQLYVHPKAVGTANYNMMFQNDYLELLVSVEDNPRNAQRRVRLATEGDGLKDMGLRTGDADAAFETVKAAGLSPLPVFDHHRPEGNETARFRIIYLPADRLLPGLGFHVIQHLTPELIWKRNAPAHPNGARGIAGLVIAAADPTAIAAPYAKVFGVEPQPDAGGTVTVAAGKSRLRVAPTAEIAKLFPGIHFKPAPPFVAALELFVADPRKTATFMAGAGVPHRMAADGAVEVPPEQACGVVLRFTSAR